MLNFLRRDARRPRRDPRTEVEREMFEGIVDGIWLDAWAQALEEEGKSPPRSITRETAPPAPESARKLAEAFARNLEEANNTSLLRIYQRASDAEGEDVDAESLGFDLTMQAMGHGISWFDDHAEFNVVLPYLESHAYKSGRKWFVDGSTSNRLARPARDRSRRSRSARPRRTRASGRRRGY